MQCGKNEMLRRKHLSVFFFLLKKNILDISFKNQNSTKTKRREINERASLSQLTSGSDL